MRRVLIGFCLFIFLFSSLGCEPLRKKFTRKKKEQKSQDSGPVLTPIDYPPKMVSSLEKYEHHYGLWRVWYKDFMDNILRNEIDKKLRYDLGQMIVQVEEMKKYLVQEKQKEISGIWEDLHFIRQELEKPENMRRGYFIKRRLQDADKRIRNHFKPALMKDFFSS